MSGLDELAVKSPPNPLDDNPPPPPITMRRPNGNDLPILLHWLRPRLLETHPAATIVSVNAYLIQCVSDNGAFFICNPDKASVVLATSYQDPLGEEYAVMRFAVSQHGVAAQQEILRIIVDLGIWARRHRFRAVTMPPDPLSDVAPSEMRKALAAINQSTRKQTAFILD